MNGEGTTALEAIRQHVARRQLETGFEFNPMPGSRGVSLDPGEPARRSRAELEAIVAGRPAAMVSETPVSPPVSLETETETETETAVSPWVAAGVSRATWYRKAKPADETAVSETPVKPWVAAGVSRASWYRHHRG